MRSLLLTAGLLAACTPDGPDAELVAAAGTTFAITAADTMAAPAVAVPFTLAEVWRTHPLDTVPATLLLQPDTTWAAPMAKVGDAVTVYDAAGMPHVRTVAARLPVRAADLCSDDPALADGFDKNGWAYRLSAAVPVAVGVVPGTRGTLPAAVPVPAAVQASTSRLRAMLLDSIAASLRPDVPREMGWTERMAVETARADSTAAPLRATGFRTADGRRWLLTGTIGYDPSDHGFMPSVLAVADETGVLLWRQVFVDRAILAVTRVLDLDDDGRDEIYVNDGLLRPVAAGWAWTDPKGGVEPGCD